jgi:hypothetical protein
VSARPSLLFRFLGGDRGQVGELLKGCAKGVGMEAERTGLAFVGDAAILIDQVDAVGPSGVGLLGGVTEFVEDGGEFDSELANAGAGDQAALVFVARAREDNVVLDVRLHLPDVAGMGLKNVDGEEGHLLAVLIVELVEGRNLPPEGRSSVAAEDEDDGLVECRELNAVGLIQFEEVEVGGGIAGLEVASAGLHPERLEWGEEKDDRTGHVRHDAGEFLRRLMHRPVHETDEDEPDDQKASEGADCDFLPGRLLHAHPHDWAMVQR